MAPPRAPRGRSPRSRDRRLTHARPLRGNRRTGFTLVRGLGSRSHVGRLERRGAGVLHARDGAFKSSSFPLVTLSERGWGRVNFDFDFSSTRGSNATWKTRLAQTCARRRERLTKKRDRSIVRRDARVGQLVRSVRGERADTDSEH